MSSPLHQFEVKSIIPIEIDGIDLSFTNASLFMVLSVLCGFGIMWFLMRRQLLIPSTAQSVGEALFGFVRTTAKDCIGAGYERYLPFILTVFLMVFFGNFLGLFPYAFTYTSQLAPVGTFAVLGLIVSICIGLANHGVRWFRTFLPEGIPLIMAPIVVPIEIFSFLAKPFSLTVRLVMNMIVGHILLKIIAGFVYSLGLAGGLPLFEVFIAFLQAYIYTILTSIYIGEAVHSH